MFLKDNDLIDVTAPGFRAKVELVNQSALAFHELGLRLRYPEDLYGPDLMCSNSVEIRVKHFLQAIAADDSQLLWFLRGGYGSIHLLPHLDKIPPPEQKKFLIGYSDVTSLMIYAVQKWKWKVIHGPLVDGMTDHNVSKNIRKRVISLLRGELDDVAYPITRVTSSAPEETITGEVLGGNVLVSGSTLGTPYQLEGKDRILVFEEMAERAYRIDRVLVQMKQAGVFNGVKAVIFGEFIDCIEPDGSDKIPRLIEEFANSVDFPVYKDLHVGHGKRQNPLPMGTQGRIQEDGWFVVDV